MRLPRIFHIFSNRSFNGRIARKTRGYRARLREINGDLHRSDHPEHEHSLLAEKAKILRNVDMLISCYRYNVYEMTMPAGEKSIVTGYSKKHVLSCLGILSKKVKLVKV